jgi:hypothetical protein
MLTPQQIAVDIATQKTTLHEVRYKHTGDTYREVIRHYEGIKRAVPLSCSFEPKQAFSSNEMDYGKTYKPPAWNELNFCEQRFYLTYEKSA